MAVDQQRVDQVFLAAREIADPQARAAVLDRECGADAELRQQVEALLAAHERPPEFLNEAAVQERPGERASTADATIILEASAKGPDVPAAWQARHHPATARVEEAGNAEDDAVAFLQPSTKPGSLGRLGHYEILEVLGRGGFGTVLKAFDETLHRVVAIKVLSPQIAATSPARKRFLREARAAAAIRHESVVAIYAVEEQPFPYLVMEFIPGLTLQQQLDQTGPMEVAEVLRLGQQIAGGLAAAHAQGLIHRDIKPGNILLETGVQPRVKITDFGLARTADDASLSQSGVVTGTPMFMAPEQAQGEPIDQRADLFSLGSVLYTMASGRPPFRASNTLAVLKRVSEDTPRPIREIIPEVPVWLCDVIAKLHAKKPADRYDSAQEVADLLGRSLAALQQQGGLRALPESAGKAAAPAPATSAPLHVTSPTFDTVTLAVRPPGLRKRRWVAAAMVLFVLLAGLGLTELTGVTNLRGTVFGRSSSEETRGDGEAKPAVAGTTGPGIQNKPVAAPLAPPQQQAGPLQFRYQGVAFSPDGKHIATAALVYAVLLKDFVPGEVTVWDAATGKLAFSLATPIKGMTAVAFSPDGKRLAAAGSGTVSVWDLETRKEVGSFQAGGFPGYAITRIDFSPDGKLLATACGDGSVKLWDLTSGRDGRVFGGQTGYRSHVTLNKDGSLLASACAQSVMVWNVKTGALQQELRGHANQIFCVDFSPDGKTLASASQDGVLKVWDLDSGKDIMSRPRDGPQSQFYSVVFSPDGKRLAAAGNSSSVRILDPLTGKTLLVLPHPGRVFGVAFSRDGSRLVSCSEWQTIRVWDTMTGRQTLGMGHPETTRVIPGQLPAPARPPANLAVGARAPDIEGEDIDGRKFKLSDYRGKVILLDFWGHWCGPCRAMYPQDRALVKRLDGKPFVLLGVNNDPDQEALRRLVAQRQITWRFFVDGRAGPITKNWDIQAWPSLFLIDHRGVIRLFHRGNPGEEVLNRKIDELLAELGAAGQNGG